MAKLIGPIGSKMRGKVGQIVAAKTVGGDTAIRSYQPQVKNPNTLRQRVSRSKMAMASEYAALLAEAVNAGYAKYVQSMKMYPRNAFVAEMVPVGNGHFLVNDGVVSLASDVMPISKRCGISVVPSLIKASGSAESVDIVASNIGDVTLQPGENVALFVAAYSIETRKCIVKAVAKPASGETTVNFSAAEIADVDDMIYVGFYKVIPEALNGVPTDTIPWKYPSGTSESVEAVEP